MSAMLETQEPSARYLYAAEPQLVQQFELLAGAPGGIARLRELIFALAVRGKLVPQDARDEPVSVLLQRIGEEKAAAVQVSSSVAGVQSVDDQLRVMSRSKLFPSARQ